MSIELPPSGYEKSPEACSGMLMFRVINAKQYKVISNRMINLSAYGQASLGISSIANIVISVQTIEYVVELLVENSSVYNYWVRVKRQDGSLVTNTSIKVSIVYFEL